MLEAARLALCDVGVLKADEPMPPFTVRMTGNMSFLVYHPRGDFHLVKIGLHNDLQREFDGFSAGHAALPRGVPRPLALARHRSFPTLVTTGIPLIPLGALSMRAPSREVRKAFADYFSSTSVAFRVDQVVEPGQRLREALAGSPVPRSASVDRYLELIGPHIDALSAVRQHGDFYLNNLGMRGDALIVLDWEDYGRTSVPGYDLALLLLSLNDFSPTRLRENTRVGAVHEWILRAGTTETGLDPDLFIRLLPVYLMVTARIKTGMGYGEAVRARALGALPEALHLAGAPSERGGRS